MGILIRRPGALATIQDYGRYGYQEEGVSPAGVMDRRSTAMANLLAGNPENEAVIEVLLGGLEILFESDAVIAVCGADLPISLDGVPQEKGTAIKVHAGQILSLGYASRGLYSYLAFAGGLQIPLIMGSRSTHMKSREGGLEGRKLLAGDRIEFRAPVLTVKDQRYRFGEQGVWPKSGETVNIHLIMGPQDDCFTEQGKKRLFQTVYEVSSQSDRMGYRLKEAEEYLNENGVKKEKAGIEYAENVTGITDGVVFGSVQIPPSGLPIIMMADRQTTGGYPKIATVITEDLPLLAQSPPGTKIKFHEISVEAAQERLRKRSKPARLRLSYIVSAIFRVHNK